MQSTLARIFPRSSRRLQTSVPLREAQLVAAQPFNVQYIEQPQPTKGTNVWGKDTEHHEASAPRSKD